MHGEHIVAISIMGMILTFLPITLAVIFWFRIKKMQHDQIMAMVDKDVIEGSVGDFYNKRKNRKYRFLPFGGLFLGIGVGIFLATFITSIISRGDGEGFYFGLILTLGSVGYILGNMIRLRMLSEDEF